MEVVLQRCASQQETVSRMELSNYFGKLKLKLK